MNKKLNNAREVMQALLDGKKVKGLRIIRLLIAIILSLTLNLVLKHSYAFKHNYWHKNYVEIHPEKYRGWDKQIINYIKGE